MGIYFIPRTRLFTQIGKSFYLSAGLEISYQFGLGNPDRYKAYDHLITIATPIAIHMRLNEQHSISIGSGFLYTFDLLWLEEPYEEGRVRAYRSLGTRVTAGYAFKVKANLSLTFDQYFDIRFYEEPQWSYSTRIGIDWRFISREVVKKW